MDACFRVLSWYFPAETFVPQEKLNLGQRTDPIRSRLAPAVLQIEAYIYHNTNVLGPGFVHRQLMESYG
jgi:hypothetical protein